MHKLQDNTIQFRSWTKKGSVYVPRWVLNPLYSMKVNMNVWCKTGCTKKPFAHHQFLLLEFVLTNLLFGGWAGNGNLKVEICWCDQSSGSTLSINTSRISF